MIGLRLKYLAIDDPNTGLRLWESGAIVQYLIEQYDTEHKLSYPSLKERHLCNQWLAFQISGQGPYFGQAGWFNVLHPEKLPSAMERYNNELKRILSVLDGALEGKQWLVGSKATFADLAFAPWNDRIDALILSAPEKKFDGFPNVQSWHERITSRAAWNATMKKRDKLMDDQGLQPNGMPKGVKSFQEYEDMIKTANAGNKA